jgi:2-polyprenyl-3-methyl-5-hydroxy-6-metoxy-1,4-benzoquinol methylase
MGSSTVESGSKFLIETCRLCGQNASPQFSTTDLNRHITEEVFRYHRCGSCATVFLAPIPCDLSRYYPPEYYAFPRSRTELVAGAEAERYKIDLVRQFVPAGRLLEIGPGTGGFAHLAKEAGFEVEAVEMDAAACRYLSEVVGIRAVHADATSCAFSALDPFDVITAWHVIEHVPEPWAMLASAADRLANGGVLIVAAPNPDALQFSVFGRYWTHVDAPRHLCLLPAATLERRATSLGLSTVLKTTSDPGGIGWNAFGWRYSLRNALRGKLPDRIVRSIARVLGAVLGPVERGGLRGSTYTMVFERRSRT